MSNIDFYFSIGSTYTYLSVTRILDVEKKHGVKFNWKPFSVRIIMNEMNNHPFPDDKKSKVDYMWRDIERRAEDYGFFAKTPVPYPLTQLDLANKLAILGLKEGWGIDYVRLTYKRWFQEGKEPATEPNISEIFKELKIDQKKVMEDVIKDEIENQYAFAKKEGHTNSAIKALELLSRVRGAHSENEIDLTPEALEENIIKYLKILGKKKVMEIIKKCGF